MASTITKESKERTFRLTTVIRIAPMRSVHAIPWLRAVARRVILHGMVNVIARGARHVYWVAVHASSRCLRHTLNKKENVCSASRKVESMINCDDRRRILEIKRRWISIDGCESVASAEYRLGEERCCQF